MPDDPWDSLDMLYCKRCALWQPASDFHPGAVLCQPCVFGTRKAAGDSIPRGYALLPKATKCLQRMRRKEARVAA